MDWSDVNSMWKGHEYFAQWLIKELDPKITVEIGTYQGFSAYWLAKENNGTVYTIDIKRSGAEENCNELDNIIFIEGESVEVSKTWDKKIDLLHIDGNHNKEYVAKDLESWIPHLNKNAVILMHDVFTQAVIDPFLVFMNLRAYDEFGGNIRKRMFLENQGLGILTFDDDIIEKMDKKYGNRLLKDHSVAAVVQYINHFNNTKS